MNRRLLPVAGTPFLAQRLVIFFGSCWLLLSWVLVIGLRRPMLPNADTWLPGIRIMLVMAAVGLVIVWPMAAMSSTRRLPTRRTFRETCILLLTAQLIIWPAGLVTNWSLERTVLIAVTLSGWGLLAGALAGWGRSQILVGRRLGMMAMCLMMSLTAPVIMLLVNESNLQAFSPLSSMWTMATSRLDPSRADWIISMVIWAVAVLGWALIAVCTSCDVPEHKRTSHS